MVSCFSGVFGVKTDVMKTVVVTEGDDVTLHAGVSVMKDDVQILWMFGRENSDTLIAEIYKLKIYIFDSHASVMKGKLQMESQTGSLIIRNISSVLSGLYKVQIINTTTKYRRFNLTVYARVSLPVIESSSVVSVCQTSDCQKSTASCIDPDKSLPCEVCAVMCSADNGADVSLSWFKNNERLNQTSSPDLNISLSLSLEIKERNNTYYCVAANPVNNLTTQLNFQEQCQQHTDLVHSCNFTEAVIRLVISALVSVATVAILVYDFRS
ncbi:hepatocyte cell adhesion molecule-like isoform X1 [Triplophysa dalaica]|uniref:hepatocyte cell adhesion molecule-like isoform X1 n=1 Tax=Triplophysa dalaica TaxID=1582913 RepID=UPI0024DFE793|nr:hepatocyte cell adhesion molecule-like isoform X1 [Triplophysa dalaica]